MVSDNRKNRVEYEACKCSIMCLSFCGIVGVSITAPANFPGCCMVIMKKGDPRVAFLHFAVTLPVSFCRSLCICSVLRYG